MMHRRRTVAALSSVTKSFGRSRPVLDHVSVDFHAGATYIIRGGSGSGKSTMLNLLAGYLDCDSGRVETPERVSYLFQDEALFSKLTVRDNMAIRLAALGTVADADSMMEKALARVGVLDLVDDPISHLSGGERQRVQLAGLLVSSPELILLDEPTSSLDPETRREVCRAIDELFGDVAVVIVSHDPELRTLFDGVVSLSLRNGRLEHE